MKKKKLTPSAAATLRRLGEGVQVARRRRRIRQRDLAGRMGVSVGTLRALESGDPGVSMGSLAMAMLALGMLPKLDDLFDIAHDDIGMLLDLEALPKRVRLAQTNEGGAADGSLRVRRSPEGALL